MYVCTISKSTGCSEKNLLFQGIFRMLPPLAPSPVLGCCCSENCEPIKLIVHSHCVENFEAICRREMGCRRVVKTKIFPEHTVEQNCIQLSLYKEKSSNEIILAKSLTLTLFSSYLSHKLQCIIK